MAAAEVERSVRLIVLDWVGLEMGMKETAGEENEDESEVGDSGE
jgi:hypothetical protein